MRDQRGLYIAELSICLCIVISAFVTVLFPTLGNAATVLTAGAFGTLFVTQRMRYNITFLLADQLALYEKLMSRSFLADVLLPVKLSNDLHANLDEAMPLWIAAHGERRALWIRRSQEAQTIAKYWMTPLRNLFQAVFKLIR